MLLAGDKTFQLPIFAASVGQTASSLCLIGWSCLSWHVHSKLKRILCGTWVLTNLLRTTTSCLQFPTLVSSFTSSKVLDLAGLCPDQPQTHPSLLVLGERRKSWQARSRLQPSMLSSPKAFLCLRFLLVGHLLDKCLIFTMRSAEPI